MRHNPEARLRSWTKWTLPSRVPILCIPNYDLMLARQEATSPDEVEENQRACLAKNDLFKDWICDERRMSLAKSNAIYMHCLPADRGSEVTDAVIDGPQSIVFPEAENRLHTAKAIMACTMRERPFR